MIRNLKLKDIISTNSIDSILISDPISRLYFTGFKGTSGFGLITNDKNYFITDFRYKDQATSECTDFEVLITSNELTLDNIIASLNLTSVGYEDESMTVKSLYDLEEALPDTKFVPLGSELKSVRKVKDDHEISMIRKASSIADSAFEYILKILRHGMTEKEVALELEYFMRQKGASGTSFETIVASGLRSALPHGVATDKVIEIGDFVTMDFGCVYQGYRSDMTRTVVMGKASTKQREIYDIVLRAQVESLKEIKASVSCKHVDTVARNIITDAGYGENFGHGTGHSIGLELHEFPRFSQVDESILEVNHVMTDEPGIYIPDFGGVRIEDLVVVTENGYDCLSKSSKKLIEII